MSLKTAGEKSSTTTTASPASQVTQQPFFGKAAERGFFEGTVQTKLTVGKPGDKFEKEADSMAEKVVQRTESGTIQQKCASCDAHENAQRKPLADNISPFVQRQVTSPVQKAEEKEEMAQAQSEGGMKEEKPLQKAEMKEEKVQAQSESGMKEEKPLQKAEMREEKVQAQSESGMKEEKPIQKAEEKEEVAQMQADNGIKEEKPLQKTEAKEETAQAKTKGGAAPAPSTAVESSLHASKGQGSHLPDATRSSMESGFGVDFKGVRIHTGSAAVNMSKSLHAQAFTHGNDIYFNEGKFNPSTREGKTLLAHELTHTVQQGASVQRKPEISHAPPALVQREEENADLKKELEEADKAAKNAIDPGPARKTRAEASAVQAETDKKATNKHAKKKGSAGKKAGKTVKAGPASKKAKAGAMAVQEAAFKKQLGAVGKDLSDASAFACAKADEKTTNLAENEQTHDDATQKQQQTDSAVVPPAQEGQAMGNSEQVQGLDAAPPPQPDKEAARRTMTSSLGQAMPTSIEEINEFESQGKAQVVGNQVLSTVSADVGQVQDKYNDIEQPPAPKPTEEPVVLPAEEVAPSTPALNLGKGAVPNLKPEHTDVKAFDKQSDDLLQKEGISEEQLNMVDSGDLADANKERKGLKKKVAEEPLKIQQEAQKQTQQVEKDLQQEETKNKTQMRQKRKGGLNDTRDKQQKTKSALEKKREEVTSNINGIYERAKKSVTEKLGNLEKQNLTDFDAGQQSASVTFEQEVKRDINAWKRERYSGMFGGVKWLKDKIVGIDHFPEVQQALTRGRENYIRRIDALIVSIDNANQRVIQDCKRELAAAQTEIQNYVKTLGPALKATGQAALTEMKSKLAEMDKFIDAQKDKLREKLCSKREEAIKKIDEKIEKMKEEMSGLLSKLGNLILEALLKFFKWALEKAGYSPEKLMEIINKGKVVIKKIVTSPGEFFGNLAKAVKGGVDSFKNNIQKHLISGVVGWLTGAMSDAGLQLPSTWDIKGIFFLLLQILNLTKDAILKKLSDKIGRPIVEAALNVAGFVKRVVDEGPMALWDMLKEQADSLKEKVMETIRNWVATEMIKQGVIKLVSMLNPVGAIVQLIIGIYNAVMFFVENWSRIVEFVKTIFGSIADIAMGRLGGAIAAIEKALGMTIPIILNFIARMLGLSGIGKAIRKAIEAVRAPIDRIVDKGLDIVGKVVKGVVAKVKGVVMKGKEKAVAVKDKIVTWWKEKMGFTNVAGEKHTLLFTGEANNAKLKIRSTETDVETYLENYPDKTEPAFITAKTVLTEEKKIIFSPAAKGKKESDKRKQVITALSKISAAFVKLGGGDIKAEDYPKATAPQYSGTPPTNNKVMYLVGKPKVGSAPPKGRNTGTSGWDEVWDNDLTLQSDKWVQMHVVSEQLGGAGIPANLIAAPGSINTGHFRTFEHSVLKLANEKSGRIKNVVWFDAKVDYYDGKFASNITGKAGLYLFKGKKKGTAEWIKHESPSLEGHSKIPLPDLQIQKKVSLNYSSGTDLRKVIKDSDLVNAIKLNRYYDNIDVFEEKMKAALKGKYTDAAILKKITAIKNNAKIVVNNP